MEFKHPFRVYIEDTDAGGIVYYVNYLKFMERARTELLRWHGFGKDYIFCADLMFVVTRAKVDYLLPAKLDDELHVTADITRFGGANLVFAQEVKRGDDVLARGEVTVVCVDRQAVKPRRIPKEMLSALRGDESVTE